MSLYCTIIALCYINYTYIYIHQVVCSRIDDPSIWCERSSHNCRRFSTRAESSKSLASNVKELVFHVSNRNVLRFFDENERDFHCRMSDERLSHWSARKHTLYRLYIMYRLQGLYLIIYTPETWTATPIENGQRLLFLLKMVYFLVAM